MEKYFDNLEDSRAVFFLIGTNSGTGCVTTMAKTGAEQGMGLLGIGTVVHFHVHLDGCPRKGWSIKFKYY